MPEERNPALEKLQAAVQEFAQSINDHPIVVTTAVLAFERVRLDEDGDGLYRTDYSIVTDGSTPAAAMGVMVLASDNLGADLTTTRED